MFGLKKILIVGGVAGGASAAARARRLSEEATIVLIERGPNISFANCGLPYHIGGDIPDRNRLLVQTPEAMRRRFRIDVRVNTEALSIDRDGRRLRLRDLLSQTDYAETYDILILSPGAEPLRPPIPGVDLPGIFSLRSLEDMDGIQACLSETPRTHATVVGGGFIGVEMAEALRHRGLSVTLVEMAPQLLSQLDPEMAVPVQRQMEKHGVQLRLGQAVNGFSRSEGKLRVQLTLGETLTSDLVILAIGIRPEVKLAREAGLVLGASGGIAVNEHMQTSDPAIYAVGDAVETPDVVGGQKLVVPLAGPANRQGRIAADNALGREQSV
ncbi:MAG: FAD-dependent oxidoreductase, partial [Candidatus Firestonebacteria bacterium]|nr:FAD-dependent oxidoreductase [Candidatus Firestonebacteria bacterium]